MKQLLFYIYYLHMSMYNGVTYVMTYVMTHVYHELILIFLK